jgi:hypothetical protein
MSAEAEGVVYEIHFDEPIGNPENPRAMAQHYTGYTSDLASRLEDHRHGRTAAIMHAVRQAGVGWRVVRTWPGTRDTERAIKDLHAGRRLCPECTERPLTGAAAVARAAELRRAREATRETAPELPRPAPPPPYEAGQRMARRFLQQQTAAGRTAAQIEETHDYITGPWRERTHATAAQAETFRGYADLVEAALARLREDQAAPGRQAQQEMEPEAG